MTAIEQMLDHYGIDYRGSSGEQAIRCPVHDDTHASASLHGDKELFYCHACGASGDVYEMVKAREGIDFASAKRFVEAITGVHDQGVRGEPRARAAVPKGSGYRPAYRRKISAGRRKRLEF